MNTLKLALIGYGNAAKAFTGMLNKKKNDILSEYGCKVDIVAICTKSKGAIINPNGIDINIFKKDNIDSLFNKELDSFYVIDNVDYDVMIETTPINIFTGQPAIDHIKHTFDRKKHVITANKGPIARAYSQLKTIAEDNNSLFFYETTVMDGTPVFNLVEDTLRGCKITGIQGILNSTTNYVLNEIGKGIAFEEAVAEGQIRGFVEADPSMDLDGWDSSAKLTALMNVMMDARITPDQINRTGITKITKEDLDDAKSNGNIIKLMCKGEFKNGRPVGIVAPLEISQDSMFATINGTAAALTITTDLFGDISIIEHVHEPEIDQTAYGILSDLYRVLENI